MSTISAILLAAGESRRMGELNKLELTVEGEALVCRMARTLVTSRLEEVVAVIGHEGERVRALLEGLALTLVKNTHYRDGQMTSVHAGLAALSRPCDGVMVCLSDQPLLEPADIDHLVRAFTGRKRGSVLVPTYRGRRGNPIILAYQHRQAILAGDRNLGCKRFIEKNPDLVETVEMDTDHVVFDLDTPEDYRDLLRRLGEGQRGAEARRGLPPEAVGVAKCPPRNVFPLPRRGRGLG